MKYKEEDKDKIFFTADTHFGHGNVLKFDKSPYWSAEARSILKDVASAGNNEEEVKRLRLREREQLRKDIEKQDEAIIENWNACVGKDCTVFHLGDVAFINDTLKLNKLLARLNGNIVLVTGNHEKPALNQRVSGRFQSINKYLEIRVGSQDICLFHYPIHEWNKCHRGSWSLHGHTHGNDTYEGGLKRENVGIMLNEYKPYSYRHIETRMRDRRDFAHH